MSVGSIENGRYEIKAATTELSLWQVKSWLAKHPSNFQPIHLPRWVNSLYFDTIDYKAACENLTGVSDRTKLRLRWYGLPDSFCSAKWEVKIKRNAYGWKNIFHLNRESELHLCELKNELPLLKKMLPLEFSSLLSSFNYPSLLVRYSREYFQSQDGSVRVTIDRFLSSIDQRPYFPKLKALQPGQPVVIVEFKFHRCNRLKLHNLLSSFPVRISRYSKYVSGTLMHK